MNNLKHLVVIFLPLSKSKTLVVIFAKFEQVEKLVLLTLDSLSCFSDGCFLDNCFLDDCFLDDWLLLKWLLSDFEQVKNLVVILLTLNKSKKIFVTIVTICIIFYMIISQNLLLPLSTYFHLCFLFVRICMDIKTPKVLIFLFVKNIVTWIIFEWTTNTKSFINTNIYHHNDITAKSWVLANISAKNF